MSKIRIVKGNFNESLRNVVEFFSKKHTSINIENNRPNIYVEKIILFGYNKKDFFTLNEVRIKYGKGKFHEWKEAWEYIISQSWARIERFQSVTKIKLNFDNTELKQYTINSEINNKLLKKLSSRYENKFTLMNDLLREKQEKIEINSTQKKLIGEIIDNNDRAQEICELINEQNKYKKLRSDYTPKSLRNDLIKFYSEIDTNKKYKKKSKKGTL